MNRHLTGARVLLLVLCAATAAASIATLAVRASSVLSPAGLYLATSGGEPVSMYNVMKLQRGEPLYQDPRDPPFYPTTLYNAGFYAFYAAATWPWRHDTAAVIPAMRLVSLGLATLGLAAAIMLAIRGWNRRGDLESPTWAGASMALASVATCFGPLVGWWALTTRPDIGAAAFAGIGLVVLLGLGDRANGRSKDTGPASRARPIFLWCRRLAGSGHRFGRSHARGSPLCQGRAGGTPAPQEEGLVWPSAGANCFRQSPRRPIVAAAIAGGCLAAAWSFKQSAVLIAAGMVLSALWQRRFAVAAMLVIPPAVIIAGCLTLLGPDYRANVLWATSLSSFSIRNMTHMAAQLGFKGGLPLLASAAVLPFLKRASWLRADERTTLLACWLTTLAGGLVTSCRTGSEANYFFELWVVVCLLVMASVRLLWDAAEPGTAMTCRRWLRPTLAALALMAAAWAGMDLLRIAGAGDGRLGRVRLALVPGHAAEVDRAGELAKRSDGLVYCQPALSGLALNPSFPAPIFDDYVYFHRPAAERGLLRGPGLRGLLERHEFPLIVLESQNAEMLSAALAAGYVRQPGWSYLAVLEPPSSAAHSPVTALMPAGSAVGAGSVRRPGEP